MNIKTMISFGVRIEYEGLCIHSSNNYVTYASISFIGKACLTSIAWRAWPARAIILFKKKYLVKKSVITTWCFFCPISIIQQSLHL